MEDKRAKILKKALVGYGFDKNLIKSIKGGQRFKGYSLSSS